MRVLEETYKGVSEGTKVALGEIGRFVEGTGSLLIVFWKER